MADEVKVMGWPTILGIMLAVGVVTGMALGLIGGAIGRNLGPGVGAAVGVVGALLILQRRAALAKKG